MMIRTFANRPDLPDWSWMDVLALVKIHRGHLNAALYR
jgi:hypothetical protein